MGKKLPALDWDNVVKTVAAFNDAVNDAPFDPSKHDGKCTRGISPAKSNWAQCLDLPPYYAFPVTCGITFTFGGVGSEFKIMRIWFKLYPCVATVQGVIYTLTKLIDEHRFTADEVEEIRVGISETSLSHGGAIYEPHDTASAQFSLPFSLAIRLLKSDNDLSFYMDPKLWTDAKVLALARKVKSYADPNAKKDQNYNTTMEVKLANGISYKAFEPYPPGSPLNMVSRDVLRAKFRKIAGTVLTEERIDRLIEAVARLETYNDAARLIPLLVKRSSRN